MKSNALPVKWLIVCPPLHEMNNFFEGYDDKYVFSVHALIVFTIFVFYLNEKIKLEVLACSFEISY